MHKWAGWAALLCALAIAAPLNAQQRDLSSYLFGGSFGSNRTLPTVNPSTAFPAQRSSVPFLDISRFLPRLSFPISFPPKLPNFTIFPGTPNNVPRTTADLQTMRVQTSSGG